MNRRHARIAVVIAMVLIGSSALALPIFFNGFETDTSGWFGSLVRAASGTGGIPSASGSFHATTCNVNDTFTRWGGYDFGGGPGVPFQEYTTSIDIYLDVATAWPNDSRFDFSSAINDSAGNHRRDFIFNAGFYNSADVTGPGAGTNRFVISASNNSQPGSAFAKNPARSPIAISTTGWYTFKHRFYDNAGVLAVDLTITTAGNVLVNTWTLSDLTDLIPGVGGNRYGWFDYNQFCPLAFDNSRLDTAATPAISLSKTADTTVFSAVGDQITYTYVIKNTGNVVLPGPFTVTDSKTGVISPCGSGPLAVNATTSCTASYTTQASDTAGGVFNTATASTTFGATPVTSNQAQALVPFVRTIRNNTQKGSLLIWPDIDVRAGRTTLLRLTNDGDVLVYVKCIWQDFFKEKTDFVIPLTPRATAWFDAATGDGSVAANGMPPAPPGYGAGELVCFAVTLAEDPIIYNFLSGTATVMDFATGAAYEYTAAAFYNRATTMAGAPAGTLVLDGAAYYDQCSRYLLGQFTPTGAALAVGPGDATYLQNRLAVASCTQDLRQDFTPVTTKLQFDIWNAHEIKFTGAWECADSWHEVILGGKSIWKGVNPQHFTAASLGTGAAYYRVEGVASTQCDNLPPWNVPTRAVGLVGVQSSLVDLDGVVTAVGTQLHGAGTRSGQILYNPGFVTPEGRR